MTIFVDTAVLMYAAGGEHPMRAPSAHFLDLVARGEVDAVTSAEVVQEVVHRFKALRRPSVGAEIARHTLDLFAPVLPITHALMRRLPDLIEQYPQLAARDVLHVATCIHEGIEEIVSPDRGFDQVTGLRRVDPATFV